MWKGGSGLTGAKSADASLKVVSPVADDRLAGGNTDGMNWDLADLTADGTLDIVAVAPLTDATPLNNTGAAYFWVGGSGLTGTVAPTATFRAPNATNADSLGRTGTCDLLVVADVTGDGIVDLLVGAPGHTGTGAAEAGGVFLWKGVSGLSGTPTATSAFLVPGAVTFDHLGN